MRTLKLISLVLIITGVIILIAYWIGPVITSIFVSVPKVGNMISIIFGAVIGSLGSAILVHYSYKE